MGEPLTPHVAAEVRAELARRSMTWGELAAAIQKSEMWVSRRLRKDPEQKISDGDLELISSALDMPAARFLPADEQAAAS